MNLLLELSNADDWPLLGNNGKEIKKRFWYRGLFILTFTGIRGPSGFGCRECSHSVCIAR